MIDTLGSRRLPLSRGFSLLEVLIAIVVLSIGLLGLASLQLSALQGNNQSYERSQAHILAYEIADAMRANRSAAGNEAFLIAAGAAPPVAPVDCEDPALAVPRCNAAQAAAFALDQWHARLRILLPNSTAQITCSIDPCTPGAMQTVFVMWDENRKGLDITDATATACPLGAAFIADDNLACVQVTLAP